ncbi:MAG: translation initiation factor eIF-2B, partial [Nitrospinota bacterium]
ARRLSRRGIPVKLMADAAAASYLPEVSRVFVGGDALCPEGLLNKIGTYPLALAAREWGVPFFALCGSEKFLPQISPGAAKAPKPGRELLSRSLRGVRVVNYYFDLTPLSLITGVIWEEGTLAEEALHRKLKEACVHPALSASSGPKRGRDAD